MNNCPNVLGGEGMKGKLNWPLDYKKIISI